MDYFLYLNNTQAGPYTFEQIKSMWKSGTITHETMYWNEKMPEWLPIGSIASKLGVQKIIAASEPVSGMRTSPYTGAKKPKVAIIRQSHGSTSAYKGSKKRILPALLLCIFFGPVGFHLFYCGKAGAGVLMFFLAAIGGGLIYLGYPFWILGALILAATEISAIMDLVRIVRGRMVDGDRRPIDLWT